MSRVCVIKHWFWKKNRTNDFKCCLQIEHHKKDALPKHDFEDCETCTASEKHLQSTKIARQKYKDMEKPNSYAVDMQKVMLIPKLTTKESFFVSRFVCFNKIFACGSSGGKNYAIMWNESVSSRKASDVTSSYCKFLCETGEKNPIFWTDNCSAQNKNWVFYTALAQIVNSD